MIMNNKRIKITQIKSKNGRLKKHKQCLKGLGIKKIHHSVIIDNTPENLGMIAKIDYMLTIEVV